MFYKSFTAVGVINETVAAPGLVSLVDQPYHISAILINVSTHEGNFIEGWIGNEKIMEVYDYSLDTQENTAAATDVLSSVKIGRLPIDEDIPPGQVFMVKVRCGAVANDLFGSYEYTKKAG